MRDHVKPTLHENLVNIIDKMDSHTHMLINSRNLEDRFTCLINVSDEDYLIKLREKKTPTHTHTYNFVPSL